MSRSAIHHTEFALPADLTSFVGRRRDLAAAKEAVARSRLVTLTGPGGVGKTRLALRLAADLRRQFPDGVCLVELAELTTPTLLPHSVAAAFALGDAAKPMSVETLAEYLSDKRALLVLDNCEHMVDECALLARTLLRAAGELRILATSRAALKVTGEHTLPVGPLRVPDPDKVPVDGDLTHYDGVQLFIERAGARLPGFALTESNRADIGWICSRLEGNPLAIELAAERVNVLSPQQIRERLTSRLDLLTGGDPSGPSRQQTLRASIDWSYDLCTAAEKLLWSRLSVFSGGFELDAVEGVCADDDLAENDIVDHLAALLDKSILQREERGDRVRYRMLETIREFGRDQLRGNDERAELRRRHRDWYERLIVEAYNDWVGPHQQEWLARLRAEHSNIRAALDFSLTAATEASSAYRIGAWLPHYWMIRGQLSEGRHWLTEALALDKTVTVARGRALRVNAYLATLQSDTDTHAESLAAAREILTRSKYPVELAYLSFVAAHGAILQGRMGEAVAPLQDALAEFRRHADRNGECYTLIMLGAALRRRAPEQAHSYLQECLTLTAAHGERWFRSYALLFDALALGRLGNDSQALDQVREGLRLALSLDDRLAVTLCLEVVAWVLADLGDRERAARLLGAAHSRWRGTGTDLKAFGDLLRLRERCVQQLESGLTTRAMNALLSSGETMSEAQLFADALGEDRNEAPKGSAPSRQLWSPLTARERQVAEVVAEGLSNRQIAERLVISQRTAEGHIEHIMTKLGFNTRAQIAAWYAERAATAETANTPPG